MTPVQLCIFDPLKGHVRSYSDVMRPIISPFFTVSTRAVGTCRMGRVRVTLAGTATPIMPLMSDESKRSFCTPCRKTRSCWVSRLVFAMFASCSSSLVYDNYAVHCTLYNVHCTYTYSQILRSIKLSEFIRYAGLLHSYGGWVTSPKRLNACEYGIVDKRIQSQITRSILPGSEAADKWFPPTKSRGP